MKHEKFGLVNTHKMFADAIRRKYAIGAFNFYNMETLNALLAAARDCHSPIILAVSESALQYMGGDMLMGMIAGAKIKPSDRIALHLDHGHSYEACKLAIDLGFSSVMIDASTMPFDENVKLTRRVVKYAHAHDVTVESEIGTISGFEDKNTNNKNSLYTNPDDATKFVSLTDTDSLAIAIGTSHGAYKRKSNSEKLRFDILDEIVRQNPKVPLVLHGASSIPKKFVSTINKFGGNIQNANGIPASQLRHAIEKHVCKINVDSDSRLAFTATLRKFLATHSNNFNPREYLDTASTAMYENTVDEITNIMQSANKLK